MARTKKQRRLRKWSAQTLREDRKKGGYLDWAKAGGFRAYREDHPIQEILKTEKTKKRVGKRRALKRKLRKKKGK